MCYQSKHMNIFCETFSLYNVTHLQIPAWLLTLLFWQLVMAHETCKTQLIAWIKKEIFQAKIDNKSMAKLCPLTIFWCTNFICRTSLLLLPCKLNYYCFVFQANFTLLWYPSNDYVASFCRNCFICIVV